MVCIYCEMIDRLVKEALQNNTMIGWDQQLKVFI